MDHYLFIYAIINKDMRNNPIFTFADGTTKSLDFNHTGYDFNHTDYVLIMKETEKSEYKYTSLPFTLKYNGDLFKDNIKIAENINDMSNMYNNNFVCDTFDGKLLLYRNTEFCEFANIFDGINILVYTINNSYIKIITNESIYYNIDCEFLINTINKQKIYTLSSVSCTVGDMSNIRSFGVKKISKTFNDYQNSYLYLNNNFICYSDSKWNMMNINNDNIIDIYSHNSRKLSFYVIFTINKNSSVDVYNTIHNERYHESLELSQNIIFESQVIKYNGKNIFDIKNVYDVVTESVHFINSFKKQISTLFCVLNRYSKMPKVMKLLIVSKMLI